MYFIHSYLAYFIINHYHSDLWNFIWLDCTISVCVHLTDYFDFILSHFCTMEYMVSQINTSTLDAKVTTTKVTMEEKVRTKHIIFMHQKNINSNIASNTSSYKRKMLTLFSSFICHFKKWHFSHSKCPNTLHCTKTSKIRDKYTQPWWLGGRALVW